MTNEEVIEQLKDISRSFSETYFGKWREALDLAIQALEQQSRDCKTCIHSDNGNCAGTEECHECMWESKYEQQPSEDTEVIKVSKGAVKARQGRFVIYDVEWLKKNFYSTEEKIYGQPKQPCEDCRNCKKWNKCPCGKEGHENGTSIGYSIGECKDYEPCEDAVSREAVQSLTAKLLSDYLYEEDREKIENLNAEIGELPPVTPQASEEDIHREREQAYMLGYEDASKKFRTEPCEDCISREEVRRVLGNEVFELMKLHTVNPEDNPKADAMSYGVNWSLNTLMELPSVTPKYTDEEIDRAQAVEQAYVDKMVELTVEGAKRPKGKWIYKWMKGQFCSECDEQSVWKFNYCPNCGAEMSGGEEDAE